MSEEDKKKTYVIFFRINEKENNLLKKYAEENNLSVGLFSKKAVLKKLYSLYLIILWLVSYKGYI
ncbi:DUF6290 family protein [Brachyspira hyodysenteriae]|uniref:DUF6290 family protein n=1 Tax=Brachyspira hyodysenteriae TaxID=159 RepID=UPI003B979654